MRNRKKWTIILLLLALSAFAVLFHVLFTEDSDADQKYHMLLTGRIHDGCEAVIEQNADVPKEELTAKLQTLLTQYETDYPVKIRIVDESGASILDSEYVYGNFAVREPTLQEGTKESAYIKKIRDGFLCTQFLDRLDLYVSVQSRGVKAKTDMRFLIGMIFAFLGISVLAFILVERMDATRRNVRSLTAETDPLTGLYTMRYFNELYGTKGSSNTTRYKSIAVFDIDSFAGSETRRDNEQIVLSIVDLAEKLFGERGVLFRFYDDQFMILMEWSAELAYEICREFCQKVEEQGHTTVSVGLTQIQIFDTIRKNYYRAVQYCFLVKEMGGNGVKRG